MNYEKICGLVEGIIKSEFNHVQEFKETSFIDKDREQKINAENTRKLFDKLNISLTEDQQDLLNDFDAAIAAEWINLCKFYFEEGLRAGLTNLKFLNHIDGIGSYF
ncbi:hypothetical protein [Clostridium tertium]|jgi:hypothetical protein|uniref:hypothetical protein n=1 Tax=Clostridium tertium TaxID=1559 RepID=UPI002A832BF0|nr:hypothetical protein [Clostridium tertium]MDY4605862.1 hypothetical protein [Clostridium tertium]